MDLQTILNAIEDKTGIKPYTFNSNVKNSIPAINYTFYRLSDDGVVAQWRLQLRIVAETFDKVLEIDNDLRHLLVTLGDETKFNCVININGGGTLEDDLTGYPVQIAYYDLITRGDL